MCSSRSRQSKAVRFAELDIRAQDSQPDAELEKYRIIDLKGGFCELLRTPLGAAIIRLKIMGGRLHHLFTPDPTVRRVVPGPSISLTQALKDYRISSKRKIYLAYILAKSVWQYYDSDFMRAPWTADSVHFMQESKYNTDGDSVPGVDLLSPCFAYVPSILEQSKSTEYCDSYSVLHRYPKVLALGVLLVDICRTRPPNANTKAKSLEAQINNDFTSYSEIVRSNHWPNLEVWHEDAIRTYKDAVCKCLDPKLFHIPPSSKTPDQEGIKRRRNALYTYVVLPLETLCADIGIIDKSNLDQFQYSKPSADLSPLISTLLTTSGKPS